MSEKEGVGERFGSRTWSERRAGLVDEDDGCFRIRLTCHGLVVSLSDARMYPPA